MLKEAYNISLFSFGYVFPKVATFHQLPCSPPSMTMGGLIPEYVLIREHKLSHIHFKSSAYKLMFAVSMQSPRYFSLI
jgi:hypothetical protein